MVQKHKHYQVSEMVEEENVVCVRVPDALPLLLATNVNGLCLRCTFVLQTLLRFLSI